MQSVARIADRLDLTPAEPARECDDRDEACSNRWQGAGVEFSAVIETCATCRPRRTLLLGLQETHFTPSGARRLDTPVAHRPPLPSRGLGPGIRSWEQEDDVCYVRIGVAETSANRLWRTWNRRETYDDASALVAQVDGRRVRQLHLGGMDYSIVITVVDGPDLDRPVLAWEGCS